MGTHDELRQNAGDEAAWNRLFLTLTSEESDKEVQLETTELGGHPRPPFFIVDQTR